MELSKEDVVRFNALAEAELMELIRLQDEENFRIVIMRSDRHWRVETHGLDSGARGVGTGASFGEAWADQTGLDVYPRDDLNIKPVD